MNFKFSNKIAYALLFIYANSHAMDEQLPSINDGAHEDQQEVVRRGCCTRVWQRSICLMQCFFSDSPETRIAARQAAALGGVVLVAGADVSVISGAMLGYYTTTKLLLEAKDQQPARAKEPADIV